MQQKADSNHDSSESCGGPALGSLDYWRTFYATHLEKKIHFVPESFIVIIAHCTIISTEKNVTISQFQRPIDRFLLFHTIHSEEEIVQRDVKANIDSTVQIMMYSSEQML